MISLFFCFFGASCGSFIHACATRYTKSFPRKTSCCDHCLTPLVWRDKIPLLSFLILRGHCRYCASPIARSTFFFEWSSLWACLLLGTILSPFSFIQWYGAFLVLLYASKVDWTAYLIPDRCHFFLILFSIPFLLKNPLPHISSSLLYSLSILPFALYNKIGWGDVKLLFSLGLFLGFPSFIYCTLGGCLCALVHSLFIKRQPLPFAPYLFIGFLGVMLVFIARNVHALPL